MALLYSSAARLPAWPVGVAQPWGGEGGEHARVGGDRLRDALDPGEPGPDRLVGVGPVGLGARPYTDVASSCDEFRRQMLSDRQFKFVCDPPH
jgi:hypothetical protein